MQLSVCDQESGYLLFVNILERGESRRVLRDGLGFCAIVVVLGGLSIHLNSINISF